MAALKHEPWCMLVNPASNMGKFTRCNCSAGIDQTPKTWYVERKAGKKWKRVDELKSLSQHDAEQTFFRNHCSLGRLISADGLIKVYVPYGEEKD